MTDTFEASPGAFPELEVIAELGRGAGTVVYRVRRRGRDYTLKLLTDVGADERALAAVRREAALLGCVGYPYTPHIFEVGQAIEGPYLILEYVDGYPLSAALRSGPLTESAALRLAADVATCLGAAHRAGLVHRDVKPDNIIAGPDGGCRLIDFGLVLRHGTADPRIAGTLLYSAPEQTGGLRRPVDGRADLYALGVVLFEAVTGRPPYHSLDANTLVRMHADAPVPDPRSIRGDLSPAFAGLVTRLLAKDPDHRYPDAAALLADLRRLNAAPSAVFASATARPSTGGEVLVGRDHEVVHLANRWLQVRDGRGGAAIVEGPPGAGKSRLVDELTRAVQTDGDLVLYGKCMPEDPIPLAPLRTAVEAHLRTVEGLPPADRDRAVERLRRAAGRGGALLRALSPRLGDLIAAPEIGAADRHEQFTNAVAAFLVGLADESRGAVLHLDDVQWIDGPTRRVLQQMTNRLTGSPLLVVATVRDDPENAAALARFGNDLGATLDTRIQLRALNRDAVSDVVRLHLGGVRLADESIDELVSRAGGNPFTVVEYIRAVIDAGLIVPSFAGWWLDVAGLDRLDLSDDAVDLVLQRIDGLGPAARHLLAAGAATGRRFRADLVATVCDVDPGYGRAALAEAESRHLVATSSGDGYRFPHDRIREALLAGLPPETLRRLHQRIAEVLEASGTGDPRWVYLAARHYALGETDRTPRKVYDTNLAAGQLAMADHAPAEAREFLLVASGAAEAAGIKPAPDFDVALGRSCMRTGRFAEALTHLEQALGGETRPARRAAILAETALVHNSAWRPEDAMEAVNRGLAEVGKPLPRGRLVMVLSSLVSAAAGFLVIRTRIGYGRAHGPRRERLRMRAVLYDLGATASTMRMHRRLRAVLGLRSLYPVSRLGPSPEYVRHLAGFGVVADVLGKTSLALRLYGRAARAAADIGDPVLVGHVEWRRGVGRHLGNHDDGETWMRALVEHERWLDLGDYLTGVSATCLQMTRRGRTHDAETWYAQASSRLGPGAKAEGAAFGVAAAVIAAQRGRPSDAAAGIEALRRAYDANPRNLAQKINFIGARVMVLVELGNIGAPFDQVTAEFAALGVQPSGLVPEQRAYYLYEAMGRLARCHLSSAEHRPGYVAAARESVAALGAAVDSRLLRVYHQVFQADLDVLEGRPLEAVRRLADAEIELLPLDAPLVAHESARVRARALRALDEPAQARTYARIALMYATDQQWPLRNRWVRDEFGIGEATSVNTTGARTTIR